MTRPLFWLGIPGINDGATGTNAVVVVRAVTNGEVSVICNGATFSAMADTAVQDGLVRILVTGLAADTKYPYTVILPDASSASATLKTFPDTGKPRISWFSCANRDSNLPFITMHNQDPHCVICLGDFGYMSAPLQWSGYPGKGVNGNTIDAADYHQAERAHHARSYFRRMAENIPFGHIPDDHEWDINNANWDIVSGNTANIDAFVEGTSDYMIGNPVNTDNPGDLNPFYFRFFCGNVEVFVLSAVVHGKDPSDVQHMVRDNDLPNAPSGCLGRDAAGTDIRNQENWLTSGLNNSTKPWKLVLMPKQSLKSTEVNGDSWSSYPIEMNRVLQTIHDDYIQNPNNTGGTVWGCGDWHSPSIHGSESGVNGSTYDHIAVTPCPLVGDVRDSGPPSVYTIFAYNGPRIHVGENIDFHGLFGLFEPGLFYATSSIINFRGDTLASIDVRLGENKAAGADADRDGILDSVEDKNGNGIVDPGETDPFKFDTDGDGLADGEEDVNADGVFDFGETNPLANDTDGDGLSDGYEVNVLSSDPISQTTVYTTLGDMNQDGQLNAADLMLLQRKILKK